MSAALDAAVRELGNAEQNYQTYKDNSERLKAQLEESDRLRREASHRVDAARIALLNVATVQHKAEQEELRLQIFDKK